MIIGKNITKSFSGGIPLIEKADFKILPTSKIGIVGRNGCGKSTLVKMIVGTEPWDSGSIDKLN